MREAVGGSVTSPPFGNSLQSQDVDFENQRQASRGRNINGAGHLGSLAEYGTTDGQLGAMPIGAISSPPYANRVDDSGTGPVAEKNGKYGDSEGQVGNLRMASVTSPPYADTDSRASSDGVNLEKQWATYRASGGGMDLESFKAQQQRHQIGYGSSDGQISRLKLGAVTSPPFTEAQSGGGILKNGYEGPRPGGVPDSVSHRTYSKDTAALSPENIASLAIGSVTSPPYEGLGADVAKNGIVGGQLNVPHHNTHYRDAEYGKTDGQVGNATGETYWSAIATILQQLHDLLPPGGHVAWIVKSFVRDKQIVDLPAMTLELMQRQGWEPVLWVDASLVAEGEQPGLMDGVATKRRERKSFFRRLYEKKYPGNEINEEVVLIVKKKEKATK